VFDKSIIDALLKLYGNRFDIVKNLTLAQVNLLLGPAESKHRAAALQRKLIRDSIVSTFDQLCIRFKVRPEILPTVTPDVLANMVRACNEKWKKNGVGSKESVQMAVQYVQYKNEEHKVGSSGGNRNWR
jgi:hypothetical protein